MVKLTMIPRRLAPLALVIATICGPAGAVVSLGPYRALSVQGEPLLGEVDLPGITPQDIARLRVGVGSLEDYNAAGVRRDAALDDLTISLLRRSEGQYYLRLAGKLPATADAVDLFLQVQGANQTVWRDYRLALRRTEPTNLKLSLGLARILSGRGEPLRAEIDVLEIPTGSGANLQVGVASASEYAAAGLPYSPALAIARTNLQQRPDGRSFLSITSDKPVDESALSLVMDASSSAGRIVRDYSLPLPLPGPREGAVSQREARGLLNTPAAGAASQAAVSPVVVGAAASLLPPVPAPAPAPVPAPASLEAPAPQPTALTLPSQPSAEERVASVQPLQAVPPAAAAAPTQPIQDAAAPPPAESRSNLIAPTAQPMQRLTQVQVRAGDTASRIAFANKPVTVSLDQMLVAMLAANPQAFIQGNVNRLKTGAVLVLPAEQVAAAVSAEAATAKLLLQARDFDELRRKIAQNAIPAAAVAAAQSRKLKAEMAASKPKSRLSLSSAGMLGSKAERGLIQDLQQKAERSAQVAQEIKALASTVNRSEAKASSPSATPLLDSRPAAAPALPASAQTGLLTK